jgi:hypothetical protein
MKKREQMKREKIDLEADIMTDLSVADEQAEETQGGATPKLFLHVCNGQHI